MFPHGSVERPQAKSPSAVSSSATSRYTSGARGEVAGHLHPCTTVTRRGHSLKRRCFVSDGARLVMPAFGAYTGGLSVRDAAFASLFGTAYLAYALGGRRVYAVAGDPHAVRRKSMEESQPRAAAMSTVENP